MELKELMEKDPLKIYVETDEDGHIKTFINNKYVAMALEKKIDKKVDRRKVIFEANVLALGLYEAQVKLSNDIFATITIHVVEKPSK